MPFSRYGSYSTVSQVQGRNVPDGLYLRNVHTNADRELFRIELLSRGRSVKFTESADASRLKLSSGSGVSAEFCFERADSIRGRPDELAASSASARAQHPKRHRSFEQTKASEP